MAEDETIDEEIDLTSLSDEDLVSQMHDDLYDGLADEIAEGTNILLGRDWGPSRVLDEALVEGMRIVGIDFRDGILFVPEVLLSANAMKAGMSILRPLLAETGAEPIGKVVIGTVKGDIHDIGKNLVAGMLGSIGFRVIDLGVDVHEDRVVDAVREHGAVAVALSVLMTPMVPSVSDVVSALTAAGLRDRVKIAIGGACTTPELATKLGVDAMGRDPFEAVEIFESFSKAAETN